MTRHTGSLILALAAVALSACSAESAPPPTAYDVAGLSVRVPATLSDDWSPVVSPTRSMQAGPGLHDRTQLVSSVPLPSTPGVPGVDVTVVSATPDNDPADQLLITSGRSARLAANLRADASVVGDCEPAVWAATTPERLIYGVGVQLRADVDLRQVIAAKVLVWDPPTDVEPIATFLTELLTTSARANGAPLVQCANDDELTRDLVELFSHEPD